MKSQKGVFGVILILAVCLLPFSASVSGAGQVTPDKALLDQIKGIPGIPDEAKKSLAHQIAADFEAMKMLFKKRDFCCMAKLLGKRGATLVTPDFKKIYGPASAEFWQSVWKEGVELKLVPVYVHASSVKEPQPIPFCDVVDQGITIDKWMKDPGTYDAMAVLIFEFHIIEHEGGKISHNSTGKAAAGYLHKNGCPWG